MIIREIILWLSLMRNNLKNFPEVGSDNKIKALSEALNIVHKYEKIKDLTDKWSFLPDTTVLDFKDVRTIKEIIDGNNEDYEE